MKGQIPWNKGLKGIHLSPASEFKKGKKPTKVSPLVDKVCEVCESKFSVKIYNNRVKTCSVRCGQVLRFRNTKHPRWIQDRSKLKRSGDAEKDRRSSAYFSWRKEVWLRDSFACKIANPDCAGRIEAHHILGWKDYPELRYNINNGITLCHAHHPRKRAEEKRLSPYFQELVSVSKNIL